MAATRQADDELKILGLGSCVALIMMDVRAHCVGMAHVALPDSQIGTAADRSCHGRYADTAVPALIRAMRLAGAGANHRRYIVKLVGGANLADPNDVFNIGRRNCLAVKRALWEHGMGAVGEELGGHQGRCVAAGTKSSIVRIYSPGEKDRYV